MRFLLHLGLLAMITTGLAGCLSDDAPAAAVPIDPLGGLPVASGVVPEAPDPAVFVGTIVNDHASGAVGHIGHQIAGLHEGAYNLELIGFDDLTDGLLAPSGGYTELHVVGDLAVVASLTGQRGATLLDVSDPTNMKVLAHIYNADDNWDARISDDGLYLFLGCQGSGAFDCTGVDDSGETPQVTGGSVCTSIVGTGGPVDGCPGGIAVYDIEDPTAPSFVGYLPMGFTHNVFTYTREDKYYFINAAGNIGEFNPADGSFQLASSGITAVHDIAVQKHPLTGEWLLYTGSEHMSIWNVDDPFAPHIIGNVDPADYEEPIPAMWHEQTPMPCLIDGRHLTIGAGEDGGGSAQPVGVVDTTDPRNPVVLGQWQLPDAASLTRQMSYRFSLHNIDGNCDGQVAVGHYHAGVWVFDVSTPERMEGPVTLAYYMPHEVPLTAGPTWSPVVTAPIGALVSADVPNVWTAQWSADGRTLFVPDMTTGLYALSPQWDQGPAPEERS